MNYTMLINPTGQKLTIDVYHAYILHRTETNKLHIP